VSLGLDARREGFLAQLDVDGRTVTPLSEETNTPFQALLETQSVLDPDLPLGSDLREVTIAHVLAEDDPESKSGDHWRDDQQNKWKVVKREDNPADFTVKYNLMRLVPGIDK